MTTDQATSIATEIIVNFLTVVIKTDPNWQKAYLRVSCWESVLGAKASYVHLSGVEMVDVFAHKQFFKWVQWRGLDFLSALGKEKGVILLIVDTNDTYEFKFEYEDKEKWKFDKIGDNAGIPEGT